MCIEFINKEREARFIKVKKRQVNKFNRLVVKNNSNNNINGRNNNTNSRERSTQLNGNQSQATSNNNNHSQIPSTNKWVINLFITPLTPAQESLLAKGSNFAVPLNIP